MEKKYIAFNQETALYVGNIDKDTQEITWETDENLAGVFLEKELPLLWGKGLKLVPINEATE